MGVGSIKLLSGWLVPTLTVVAACCLALMLGWRNRRWRFSIGLLAAGCVGLAWLLDALFGGSWVLQPAPPVYVCALAAVPIFVLASIALGWRSSRRRQRLFIVPAVVLCTLAASALINQYYDYYPTIDAVLAKAPPHQVSLRELRDHGYLGHHDGGVHASALPAGQPTTVGTGGPVHATPPLPATAGKLLHVPIPGSVSGFRARSAWVYLPPVWFSANRPQLPVVLLVNGTPGSPDDWVYQVGMQRLADSFAATHGGWSPILVAADPNGSFTGDSECVDRRGAMVDTYLSVDVRNYVVHNFDSSVDGRRWAIEGFSEGGTCAITLALRHPELFGTFIDIAGEAAPSVGSPARTLHDLFGGSKELQAAYDPATLLREGRGRNTSAWFEVGTSDKTYLRVNTTLAQLAQANGVAVTVRQLPGVHNFRVFRNGFADSFGWLCGHLAAP